MRSLLFLFFFVLTTNMLSVSAGINNPVSDLISNFLYSSDSSDESDAIDFNFNNNFNFNSDSNFDDNSIIDESTVDVVPVDPTIDCVVPVCADNQELKRKTPNSCPVCVTKVCSKGVACFEPTCGAGQYKVLANRTDGWCCDHCEKCNRIVPLDQPQLVISCPPHQVLGEATDPTCIHHCRNCTAQETNFCPRMKCLAGQSSITPRGQCCGYCGCPAVTSCPTGQVLQKADNKTSFCDTCVPKICTNDCVNPPVTCNATQYDIPANRFDLNHCCKSCGNCPDIHFDHIVQCDANHYWGRNMTNPSCSLECLPCGIRGCPIPKCADNQELQKPNDGCCPKCVTKNCDSVTCPVFIQEQQCPAGQILVPANRTDGFCCPHCVSCPAGQIPDKQGKATPTKCKLDCAHFNCGIAAPPTTCDGDHYLVEADNVKSCCNTCQPCDNVRCASPQSLNCAHGYHKLPENCCSTCCTDSDLKACTNSCPRDSVPTTFPGSCCPTCCKPTESCPHGVTNTTTACKSCCPYVDVNTCPHGFEKDNKGCNVCRKCDPRLKCPTINCPFNSLQHGCCGGCSNCTKDELNSCPTLECPSYLQISSPNTCCKTCKVCNQACIQCPKNTYPVHVQGQCCPTCKKCPVPKSLCKNKLLTVDVNNCPTCHL